MKNIEEQLNILQKTVMNPEEKGAIRGAVVSYMQENPVVVRNSVDSRLQYRTSNVNNGLINKKNMTIAIIIALLLGGGTSFAAENALPGDVLYPIKIHVNENVQELTAVSDEAEAKVQAKLAGRRLEEVERLGAEGRLTAETSTDLKTRFENHSQKSKEHRIKVKEGGDTDTAASIDSDTEVSLEIHQRLIEDIEDSKPEMKEFLGGILGRVELHLKEVGDDRLSIEATVFAGTEVETKSAADEALNAAQNKIDEVKRFTDSQKDKMSASVQAEVDIHLKAADAAVAEGKAKIEARAYADAFALFKKAAREAQSAKMFSLTSRDLNVELNRSDDIRIGAEDHTRAEKIETDEPREDEHAGTEIKIEANGTVRVDDGVSADSDAKVRIGL